MPDIPEEAMQAAAKAVRLKEWSPDAPWTVHAIHSFSDGCAVCTGDPQPALSPERTSDG